MKKVVPFFRVALGLLFVVFGANKLLHFRPVPLPPGDAGLYYSLLFRHHIMSVAAVVELTGGALLLLNRCVALGLSLLAPVVVNILLYHFFFDSSHIALGLGSALIEGLLIYAYRRSFTSLFMIDTKPA